jgi:hypothetical protein
MCAAKTIPTGLRFATGMGLAVMVLAGCAPDPAPHAMPQPAPSAPPTSSSVSTDPAAAEAWMNGFCGAVRDFIEGSNKMSNPGGETVEAIKKGTSDQLGYYADILGKTVDGLKALPAAPVPAGDAAKKTFLDKYASAYDKATKAKADLDASPKADTAAQDRAVDGMIAAQKDAHSALDPVKAITGSPELEKAAATAKRCQP